MEPPGCPVCLQPYDADQTIPRVLPCGHSTCQTCLSQLPRSSSPHTIRCPGCTQLVKFPHPLGPTALPKNIDLLRFSSSPPNPKPSQNDHQHLTRRRRFGFPPQVWTDELYSAWRDWVLPKDAVLVEDRDNLVGRVTISLGLGLLLEGQSVSLVKIGSFESNESLFEHSYVGKVMCVLNGMNDAMRTELGAILGFSVRNCKFFCKVFGLWLDVESGCLYLVIERKNKGFLNLGNLRSGVDADNDDGLEETIEVKDYRVSYLVTVGVEICEALIALRSEGLVCGCLGLLCFQFDEFGHVYVDPFEVLVAGRKVRRCIVEGTKGRRKLDSSESEVLVMNISDTDVFVCPEVMLELLQRKGIEVENSDMSCIVGYSSDVWLLACVLLKLLSGKQFTLGMYNYLKPVFEKKCEEGVSESKVIYMHWVETINTMLETLVDICAAPVLEVLFKCLDPDPGSRPSTMDMWKSIKGLNIHCHINHAPSLNGSSVKENAGQCLILGELCNMSNYLGKELRISKLDNEGEADPCQAGEQRAGNVVEGLSAGKVHCKDMQGHLDCITGLCVGGGFLFSSSFDKTINVWSLQDFTHVHTFRGHEHRVMAVLFVDQENPLCISADNGGGIFFWEVIVPFGQEPLKKWYEEKDWRYSGIHALAVSEFGYLYTGSGDRLIKAWSLKDYTLLCSMEGHKSVVSTLAVCHGVLYSGSWDGTVRLWSLHDHSPLAVFGEDTPGKVTSVLSLYVDKKMVIASHENGYIKIWMNDVLKASKQVHNGAIFSLAVEEKWLFSGGWDRTLKLQEVREEEFAVDAGEVGCIACDSVITVLLYFEGILFVGFANNLIKVYQCG